MTSPASPPSPGKARPAHLQPVRRAAFMLAKVVSYFVYFYVLFVEIILTLGFLLLLAGANPSSSFVTWIYRSLDRAMEPFRGIFTPIDVGLTGGNQVESVFETSVLFAMIIYGILAVVIQALVSWTSGQLNRLDDEDREYQRRQFEASTYGPRARTQAPPDSAPPRQ